MAARRVRTDEELAADEEDKKRKVGFNISTENDFKLTVYCRKIRKSRSTVVDEVLGELLRGVVISFRGKSSESGEAA